MFENFAAICTEDLVSESEVVMFAHSL